MTLRLAVFFLFFATIPATAQTDLSEPNEPVGHQFVITPEDLPPAFATESVANSGTLHDRPSPAVLNVPDGFAVNVFAEGLEHPRWMAVAAQWRRLPRPDQTGRDHRLA